MSFAARHVGDELAKSTLTDRLSKLLLDDIRMGDLKPGEKLPSGQELARHYGVSLTVVRESISSLKADGIIETRQGSGAFVSRSARLRPFRIAPADSTAPDVGPDQIFELRTGIEVQAATLAAQRGTPEQLAAIRQAFENMQAAIASGNDGVGADMLFHRRIAEASGNPLFSSFLDFLGEHIRGSITMSRQGDTWMDQSEHVMAEHEAITNAICSRNVQAARDAAYAHMANCLMRCGK